VAWRVLLVDDTPEIAELLSFALRDSGYHVAVTGYTTSINDVIMEEQSDAVVLDCSVLNMSESLFDTVRDEERHAALPVVIISDTPEQAVAGLQRRRARHVRLVPKPFSGAQVVAALEELLPPLEH
jgi:two-component system phosphate regulon response regulator PhoB